MRTTGREDAPPDRKAIRFVLALDVMSLKAERSLYPSSALQANAGVDSIVLARHAKASARERQCSGQGEELEDGVDVVPVALGDSEREADFLTLTLVPPLPPPG